MDSRDRQVHRADRGSAMIAAAIVGAALVLSWGLSGSAPRYQLAATKDAVVRMDSDSGELIACNMQGCRRIELPDRAKTLGPLTVQFGNSAPTPQLPVGNSAANQATR